MRRSRYPSRRQFLKISGLSTAAVTAGCLGGNGTPEETIANTDDIEEWRTEAKSKAEEELSGDEKLQVWTQGAASEELEGNIFNGYPTERLPDSLYEDPIISDDDPWAPLKDNVEITPINSQDQAQRYRRQEETGSIKADVLTTVRLPELVKEDVPLMDLSDVPAFRKHVPERFRNKTSQIAYWGQNTYSLAYNTKTVSDPPEDMLDILEPRFADGSIMLDSTPNPAATLPLVQDEVPPNMEALGSDMTGIEFTEALADQDPQFNKSSYSLTLKTASGSVDIGFNCPLTVVYDKVNDGSPIEPVKHPSAHRFTPIGIGVSSEPPHPVAAQLFVDYLLSNKAAQLYEEGKVTVDFEDSNPPGAIDWLYADWQRSYSVWDLEGSGKNVTDTWQEKMDVPNV